MQRIANKSDFDKVLAEHPFVVAHFYTEWCEPSIQLNALIDSWVEEKYHENVFFVAVDAEKATSVVQDLSVEAVPMIVFFRNAKFVFNVEGARVEAIEGTIKRLYYASDAHEPLETRLKNIIERERIVVFLTGTPSQPQCGFTSRICEILARANISFGHFDIMTDNEVLHGLKKYSNWPTYPQVYVDGQLVGGCDIIVQADKEGTLHEIFGQSDD